MPARPWRLAIYAILVTVLLVSAPLGSFARQYLDTVRTSIRVRDRYRTRIIKTLDDPTLQREVQREIARHGSIEAIIDRFYPPPFSRRVLTETYVTFRYTPGEIATLIVMGVWPWLTLASLMIFRWSMRRARVKTGHVVRCIVYGFDWGFWAVPILLFAISKWFAERVVGLRPDTSLPMLMCAVIAAYGTYRLGSAYSRYLRFDHPYATALASQIIVGTAAASMVLFLT
jgi:hypothetical protein